MVMRCIAPICDLRLRSEEVCSYFNNARARNCYLKNELAVWSHFFVWSTSTRLSFGAEMAESTHNKCKRFPSKENADPIQVP